MFEPTRGLCTAISNTVKQVDGAVGTSLLVTVMASSTKTHMQDMMAAGGTQKHMIMEASIQGINDAYLVIVGISIVGLLLSLFIKQVGQKPENQFSLRNFPSNISKYAMLNLG